MKVDLELRIINLAGHVRGDINVTKDGAPFKDARFELERGEEHHLRIGTRPGGYWFNVSLENGTKATTYEDYHAKDDLAWISVILKNESVTMTRWK